MPSPFPFRPFSLALLLFGPFLFGSMRRTGETYDEAVQAFLETPGFGIAPRFPLSLVSAFGDAEPEPTRREVIDLSVVGAVDLKVLLLFPGHRPFPAFDLLLQAESQRLVKHGHVRSGRLSFSIILNG